MKNIITAFKEHKEFEKRRPWDATIMKFPADETIPPHYADTIEVLLCCNTKGIIRIGGKKYSLDENPVFFIPPNTVHSLFYKKNDGYVIVLKINVEEFKATLDIEKVLLYSGKHLNELPYIINEYESISKIADVFLKTDRITDIISEIMKLLNIALKYANKSPTIIQKNINSELYKIIVWTENNFSNKITLETVASVSGYAKNYFCNKFKQSTGITYLNYLNTLRIHNACTLLKIGTSIKETCEECGFTNLSYFIKIFKSVTGTTPKKYISSQK